MKGHALDNEKAQSTERKPLKSYIATIQPLKSSLLLLLIATSLIFIILADWLFWDQPIGWALGAYGLLLACAIFLWERRRPRGKSTWLITIATIILCLQCLVEPNSLTISLGVLGLVTLALVLRNGWTTNGLEWLERWGLFTAIGWLTSLVELSAWFRHRLSSKDGHNSPRWLRNWLIPVVLSLVFIILFAVANPVISQWIQDAWQKTRNLFEKLIDNYPTGDRVITWLLIGIAVWALLRFPTKTKEPKWGNVLTGDSYAKTLVPPSVITRCLLLFNALFALQIGLDLCYLWGGLHLPKGVTYAEYAHRGAYPLLAAGILAAIFVFAAFRGNPQDNRIRLARRLVFLWLFQNALLLASAAWRLWLYIGAYSLTRWRVAAAIWMLLVLCGVAWIVVRIATRRSNLWLVNVNALTALVVLFICSFCNFDGWIARFNTTHCRAVQKGGVPLDLNYLEKLGPDTLPALISFAEKTKNRHQLQKVHNTIARLHTQLKNNLDNWRGWTWRRQRLMELEYPETTIKPSFEGKIHRTRY